MTQFTCVILLQSYMWNSQVFPLNHYHFFNTFFSLIWSFSMISLKTLAMSQLPCLNVLDHLPLQYKKIRYNYISAGSMRCEWSNCSI